MKINQYLSRTLSLASACLSMYFGVPAARSAVVTWDGAGPDGKWQTGLNWVGGNPPGAGDSLIFTGNTRPVSTNNFGAGFLFSGLTFNNPAGIFTLTGNSITLGGNITDNQVISTETVGLPLVLSATPIADVVTNGLLTLSGVISGPGTGITKVDGGQLTLSGANIFTGPVTINGGTVAISSDSNLGGIPAVATPGSIVINGGTLRTTNSFTIATNRGIALGPVTGVGSGTFNVPFGVTTTYRGIIANAGTNGGLNKLSFGGLTLGGANTYTGPTLVSNGTVTLDFTAATAPANNLIATNSSLALGGSTSGAGFTNYSALIATPKASTINSQAFNGTLIDVGPAYIQGSSNTSATMNLALGSLTHNPGGVVSFLPPTLLGGNGNITTTATNVNGILGGWAFVSAGATYGGAPYPTNLATVDANGNIVNFTNYIRYTGGSSSGTLAGNSFTNATNNIMLDGTVVDVRVDADGAGTTNLFDSICINRGTVTTGWSLQIGSNNLVRLGKTGLIFGIPLVGAATWEIGNSTGGANNVNDQNVGTLTAGGPNYNSPGELIFYLNQNATGSGNNADVNVQIADNGPQGRVTVVKAGPGYLKLYGHNTYTGPTYFLGGRIQFAGGTATGGVTNGTPNPDAVGTGPCFVFPGSYLYLPPAGFTNDLFIAGNGTQGEMFIGALRAGSSVVWSNNVTLIGDATIGGSGGVWAGRISGPFNLTLGSGHVISSASQTVSFKNSANNWTGNTIMQASDHGTGNNIFINANNEIIPNGFGFGNVIMTALTAAETTSWDLRGFNETINGLSTAAGSAIVTITNSTTTNSTLVVGDNDASGSFAGILGGANLSLTKIGGGTETLTSSNTYAGITTISNGTLALTANGSISSSAQIQVVGTNSTTALDVSGLTSPFTTAFPVGLTNAALIGNASVGSLGVTNAALTLVINPNLTNIVATTLTTSGATNFVNISAVQGISGYPTTFPIIKYGTLGGALNNFVIGNVPSSTTAGFISNDVATSRLLLVLTSGPKPLTWNGEGDLISWDFVTTNWLAFGITPSTYHDADSVTFDDTSLPGATNIALVPPVLLPSAIEFTNNVLNYSVGGSGAISGFTGLVKQGAGSLVVSNSGFSDFRGGLTVGGGSLVLASDNGIQGGATVSAGATVQVGLNAGAGNLPVTGNINCDGMIIFDRGADLSVPNIIAGAGGLTKLDANMLTLSGANTYTGLVSITSGTLRAGSGSALGATNNGTIISSGATLDLNGQNLTGEPVTVAGAGVANNGAIINSGGDQVNSLRNVTVTGDVIWGGTGRWDIRETTTTVGAESADATLTGTGSYNVTKIGLNQVSLDGVQVDNNLKSINVLQGEFDVQLQGTTLGDPSFSLTVSNGATLGLYRLLQTINKPLVLNGDGATTTLINENAANTLSGAITITGTNIWNISGTSLTVSGAIGGTGSLNVIGTATLTLSGGASYPGNTTISGGALILDSSISGGGTLSTASGTTLSGIGGNTGPVQIGGVIKPGDVGSPGTFSTGPLTMTNAAMTFRLSGGGGSDLIAVTGSLIAQGSNTVQVVPNFSVSSGQQVTMISYSGSLTGSSNNFVLVPPPAGYAVHIVDPATTPGQVVVSVDHVPQNLTWHGGAPGNPNLWDVNATANWYNNGVPPLVTFGVGDIATFNDSATTGNVTLTNTVAPEDIQFVNGTTAYVFTGTGSIGGGLSPSSTFTLNGGASVTLANTGTNTYGGAVNLFSGNLQVGNGSSGGSLGGGPITLDTALVFNMNTNLVVTNNIAGNGLIHEAGATTGVTVLTGNNTNFIGAVLITSGTLKAAANGALGTNLSAGTYGGTFYPNPITIQSPGTLDITNGVNVDPANNPNQGITVAGAGAGNGAIINSSSSATFTTPNFSYVTFAGNTAIGGTGRLDWRDLSGTNIDATLNTAPPGTPYQLNKIGTNRLQLTGVQIDPAFGHIVVQSGIFGIQGVIPSLGEVTSNLVVFSNATLSFFNVSNVMSKNLILDDGAIVSNESGSNTWAGPVTLLGSNTFNIGGNWVLATAPIGGVGTLAKVTGTAPLFLAAAETYTGPTFVEAGSLCLTNIGAGDASISDSSEITVGSGAILDVIGRSDQQLTVPSGQTLTGSGIVNGSVVVNSGGVIIPGNPTSVMTVSNSASLAGLAFMAIQKSPLTNSQLRTVTGSITYGGVLTVTNLGGNMKGGESFRLFRAGGGYGGTFAATNLPQLGPGLSWNTSALGSSGTISVSGTLAPPTIGSFSYSAPTLSLSGSGGTPGGPYVVITSTNVAAPLSTWTPVVTNSFDTSGNFSWSGNVGSTNVTQFFDIRE
jgi:fibronectin-binding autotransporter adhesin